MQELQSFETVFIYRVIGSPARLCPAFILAVAVTTTWKCRQNPKVSYFVTKLCYMGPKRGNEVIRHYHICCNCLRSPKCIPVQATSATFHITFSHSPCKEVSTAFLVRPSKNSHVEKLFTKATSQQWVILRSLNSTAVFGSLYTPFTEK